MEDFMEQAERFRVGDRVHMVGTSQLQPSGIQGTIERVFVVGDLYEVRCDDRAWRRVMHHRDLERSTVIPAVNT
jgi:hypothetical protein